MPFVIYFNVFEAYLTKALYMAASDTSLVTQFFAILAPCTPASVNLDAGVIMVLFGYRSRSPRKNFDR